MHTSPNPSCYIPPMSCSREDRSLSRENVISVSALPRTELNHPLLLSLLEVDMEACGAMGHVFLYALVFAGSLIAAESPHRGRERLGAFQTRLV